jgi:hypothetical protein
VARIDNTRPGPTKRQYFRVAAKLTTILCEFRAALVAKSTFDPATGQYPAGDFCVNQRRTGTPLVIGATTLI